MNTTQIVVLALIKKADKYLFTLRNDPGSDYHNKWQIPGGGMEFAESPEEALHREVREELGIEVDIQKFIPQIDTTVRGNWQGVFLTYICTMKNESFPITINDEASEYKWMTVDELLQLPTLPGCAEFFSKLGLKKS